MGASGAVAVLYAREAKEQADPAAYLAEKEAEYTQLFGNPYNAAKYGYIDDVIEPRNTRFRICRALAQLQTKKVVNPAKKHGNIPFKFQRKMNIRKIGLLLFACCATAVASAQSTSALRINEVLTNNVSNYVDPFGNRGAWIEIYNSSAGTVQMAGRYITDDPNNPKKYMISKGDLKTKIGPRQVILIWADGFAHHGTFHTNFSLDPTRENYIGLFDASGKNLIDEVTVPVLAPDQSFGSPRDGVKERVILKNPTPEAANYVENSNPKVDKFAEKDPQGISMAITAMSVVFVALIILYLFFKMVGKIAVRMSARRAMKAGKATTLAEAKQEADIPGDVLAVISMAIYEYQEAEHDYEDAILTVKQVKRSYSPWSSKIYGLRQIPQRKS